MKQSSSNLSKCTSFGLLVALLGLLSISAAQAQILLLIDDSDPSAVTFTATNGSASVSNSSATFYDGMFLSNFLVQPENAYFQTASFPSLTTSLDGAPDYGNVFVLNSSPESMLLYNANAWEDGVPETFASGTQAFSGTTTFDFSSISASLPSAGTTGDIYLGQGGSGPLLGEYKVAPEPSVYAMMIGGLALLGFCVRRKLA